MRVGVVTLALMAAACSAWPAFPPQAPPSHPPSGPHTFHSSSSSSSSSSTSNQHSASSNFTSSDSGLNFSLSSSNTSSSNVDNKSSSTFSGSLSGGDFGNLAQLFGGNFPFFGSNSFPGGQVPFAGAPGASAGNEGGATRAQLPSASGQGSFSGSQGPSEGHQGAPFQVGAPTSNTGVPNSPVNTQGPSEGHQGVPFQVGAPTSNTGVPNSPVNTQSLPGVTGPERVAPSSTVGFESNPQNPVSSNSFTVNPQSAPSGPLYSGGDSQADIQLGGDGVPNNLQKSNNAQPGFATSNPGTQGPTSGQQFVPQITSAGSQGVLPGARDEITFNLGSPGSPTTLRPRPFPQETSVDFRPNNEDITFITITPVAPADANVAGINQNTPGSEYGPQSSAGESIGPAFNPTTGSETGAPSASGSFDGSGIPNRQKPSAFANPNLPSGIQVDSDSQIHNIQPALDSSAVDAQGNFPAAPEPSFAHPADTSAPGSHTPFTAFQTEPDRVPTGSEVPSFQPQPGSGFTSNQDYDTQDSPYTGEPNAYGSDVGPDPGFQSGIADSPSVSIFDLSDTDIPTQEFPENVPDIFAENDFPLDAVQGELPQPQDSAPFNTGAGFDNFGSGSVPNEQPAPTDYQHDTYGVQQNKDDLPGATHRPSSGHLGDHGTFSATPELPAGVPLDTSVAQGPLLSNFGVDSAAVNQDFAGGTPETEQNPVSGIPGTTLIIVDPESPDDYDLFDDTGSQGSTDFSSASQKPGIALHDLFTDQEFVSTDSQVPNVGPQFSSAGSQQPVDNQAASTDSYGSYADVSSTQRSPSDSFSAVPDSQPSPSNIQFPTGESQFPSANTQPTSEFSQLTPEGIPFTNDNNQFPPAGSQFTPGNTQVSPSENQVHVQNNQLATERNPFTPDSNQYSPEGEQFALDTDQILVTGNQDPSRSTYDEANRFPSPATHDSPSATPPLSIGTHDSPAPNPFFTSGSQEPAASFTASGHSSESSSGYRAQGYKPAFGPGSGSGVVTSSEFAVQFTDRRTVHTGSCPKLNKECPSTPISLERCPNDASCGPSEKCCFNICHANLWVCTPSVPSA